MPHIFNRSIVVARRLVPIQSPLLRDITDQKKIAVRKLVLFSLTFLLSVTSCASPATQPPQVYPTVTSIRVPISQSCTSFAAAPTPGPESPSLFPAITSADHIRGPENAPVTIMVYGDLQNTASGWFSVVLNRLFEENNDDIRFVSRIFPLVGRNDKAILAAQAVEAAQMQNTFWEMHDLLYSQQESWVNLSIEDFEQWVMAQASGLGMDAGQFQVDLKSEAIVNLVQNNFETAQQFGPFAVPLIILNGEIYLGPQDYVSVNDIVQLILLGERHFTDCPPTTVEKTKQYIATLHTEKGDVVIQLFADKAPFTVNSFVYLAQNGWYDNITFHRVIPNLYAQTGDPSGTGKGTPGYYVITEILPDLTFDKPGMVAMVNSGPDTSGSQFFVTYDAAPQFNGQYTIFGQVLSGMDVLEALAPRDAKIGVERPQGDKLLSVTIEEK
jgi:cyclophilin family peptidyl-prolyl cis-trans isomerase/protein-disulfide isomerase